MRNLLVKAREYGYLLYKENKVMIFPNLPQEALARHWKLKPVTTLLMEAQIRYKWFPVSTLLVRHQGATEMATDLENGFALL